MCTERRDEDILHDNLESLGLQVKCNVPGDGSCFFHAVLDQCNRLKTSTGLPELTNDTANPQARAMQLREAVINYFENLDPTDPLVMSMDIPGVVSSGEVERMKKYGTFVEEWIIRATAQMLGRDIHIVNSVEPCMPTGRKTKISCLTPGEEKPLLVGHLVDGCHYLSLEPASDQSTKSSADLLSPPVRRPVTFAEAVFVSSIHSRPNVGSTSFQVQSPLQKSSTPQKSATPPCKSSTPPQKSTFPHQKSPTPPQKYLIPLPTSSTLQKSSTTLQKSSTPQQKSPTPQQKSPPPQERSLAPPSVGHSPIPSAAENTTTSSEKSQYRPSTTPKKLGKEASNSPASQMQTITNEPGPRMDSDMAIVTIKDFREVTNALGPDELQHLFHHLDLEERDIENAAKAADTTDPRLQARAVLSMWKKKVGRIATRGALFAAKKKVDMEKTNQSDSKGFQQTSHAYSDYQQTQMATVERLHTRMDTLQLTSEQGNQNVQQIIKHLPPSKDQEHEETITHWKDSLAKKYSQDRQRIRFGKSSKTVADMDDIFVDLTLWQNGEESQTEFNSTNKGEARQRFRTGNEINEGRKGTKLQSCEDLLTLKSANGCAVDHIILHGPAGSGKTTLISKMAYKWSTNVAKIAPIETSSKRKKSEWSEFQIVFLLEIKRLKSESCLEEVIKKQLLPGFSVERIAYAISKLGTQCLILFDGYDEMQKDVNIDIFDSPLLSQCFVILTTRAYKIGQITMDPDKSRYARVEISGFDSENACKYIQKFFNKLRQPQLANTLIQKLEVTPMLKTLSAFPILLVMMCLLWENSHKHGIQFKTMTGLYQQAMIYLNKPFQHVSKTMTNDMITTILIKLGKPALDSLYDNSLQIRSDKFVHKEALRQSFEIGLTTQEEGNLIDELYVSFIHKTFQEFCAAFYLSNLAETDFDTFRTNLQAIDRYDIGNMEYVLRFCCGLNEEAGKAILLYLSGYGAFASGLINLLLLIYEMENVRKIEDTTRLNTVMIPHGSLNLDNDEVFSIFCYFIDQELSGKHTWLQDVCNLSLCRLHSSLDVRILAKASELMTSLRSVRFEDVNILKGTWLPSYRVKYINTLSFVSFTGSLYLAINSVIELLTCMPSLYSLELCSVHLTGQLNSQDMIRTKHTTPTVRVLTVRSSGHRIDISAETFLSFLNALPYLEEITLEYLTVTGSCKNFLPTRPLSFKKCIMVYVTISASVFYNLFQCKRSVLEEVVLEAVTVTGIHPSMSVSCGYYNSYVVPFLDQNRKPVFPSRSLQLSCGPSVLLHPSEKNSNLRSFNLGSKSLVLASNLFFIPPSYFQMISLTNIALVKKQSCPVVEPCPQTTCPSLQSKSQNTSAIKLSPMYGVTGGDHSSRGWCVPNQQSRTLAITGPFHHFLTLKTLGTLIESLQSVECIELKEVALADDLDEQSNFICKSVRKLHLETFVLIPFEMKSTIDQAVLKVPEQNYNAMVSYRTSKPPQWPPVDVNALLNFLQFMPSLTSVKLVGCTGIAGQLGSDVCKSFEFINELVVDSNANYTIEVPARIMLKILGCMPSLTIVNFKNVNLTGEILEEMKSSCLVLQRFHMMSGSLSLKTLISILNLMPSVETVKLVWVQLTSTVMENVPRLPCSLPSLKTFVLCTGRFFNDDESEVNTNIILQLLSCMSSVEWIRLVLNMVGEVDTHMPLTLKALNCFEFSGKASCYTIMTLLSSMPAVRRVNIGLNVMLTPMTISGEFCKDVTALCNAARYVVLCVKTSAKTLMSLLTCFPSVTRIVINIHISDESDFVWKRLYLAVEELQVTGHLSVSTLLRLLGSMPSLTMCRFLPVSLTGRFDGKESPMCKALTDFTLLSSAELSLNTVISLLRSMPSVEKLELECKKMIMDMNKSPVNLPLCRFLHDFSLIDSQECGCVVDISTVFALLRCMPCVESVRLRNVDVTKDTVIDYCPKCVALKKLQMSGSVSTSALATFMMCIPSTATVELTEIKLKDISEMSAEEDNNQVGNPFERETPMSCIPSTSRTEHDKIETEDDIGMSNLEESKTTEGLKNDNEVKDLLQDKTQASDGSGRETSVSTISVCATVDEWHFQRSPERFKCTISPTSLLKLLRSMPLARSVKIDLFRLTDEIEISMPMICSSLTHFQIGGSFSGNTLLRLLSFMPAVSRVNLLDVDLEGEVDDTQLPMCTALCAFSFKGSSSFKTLMKLLHCIPVARYFRLAKGDVKGDVKVSLSEFMFYPKKPTCMTNSCKLEGGGVISSENVVNLFSCIPSLADIRLEDLTIEGAIHRENLSQNVPHALTRVQIQNSSVHSTLLMHIIDCMQIEECKMIFDIVGDDGGCQTGIPLCSGIRIFSVSGPLCANSLVTLLGYIPAVTHVNLKQVEILGEIETDLLPIFDNVKVFHIVGLWEESMLKRLIKCLSSVEIVAITHVDYLTYREKNPNVSCNLTASSVVTMLADLPSVSQLDIINCSETTFTYRKTWELLRLWGMVSADTLLMLLNSFNALVRLDLHEVKLTGEVASRVSLCTSIKRSRMNVNVSTELLLQFLSYMPLLIVLELDISKSRTTVDINTLMQMFSLLSKVEIFILNIAFVSGELDDGITKLSTCRSLKTFKLSCEWNTNAKTFGRFLGCMLSTEEMNLSGCFKITGNVDDCILPVFHVLGTFVVSGSMGADTLSKLLSCMPSLKSVAFDGLVITGEVQRERMFVCNEVKELRLGMKGKKGPSYSIEPDCKVGVATAIDLLKHFPSVSKVRMIVDCKDHVLDDMPSSLNSIKHLAIQGASMDMNVLMQLFQCMMSISSLHLAPVELHRNFEGSVLPSCRALKEFTLGRFDVSESTALTLNANTLAQILNCMPEVAKLHLIQITLLSPITADLAMPTCNSITEFYINGQVHGCTLLGLFHSMPFVSKVTMERVDIQGNVVADTDLILKGLQTLAISSCTPPDHSLIHMLSHQKDLKFLNWTCCKRVTEEDVCQMIPTDCQLEILSVTGMTVSLSPKVTKVIESILPSLRELHVSSFSNILYVLHSFKVNHWENLSKGDNMNLPLECLELSSCEICDNADILNQASQYMPCLKRLLLPKCKLKKKHFDEMSKCFSAHKLEELDLSENAGVLPMLAECCQYRNILSVLKLSSTGLTDQCVGDLHLDKLVSLKVLDVSRNNLTSEAAVDFAQVFQNKCCPLLECLNLGNNQITSYGTGSLARSFKHIPLLKELILDNNAAVGTHGVKEVFLNLKYLPNLDKLGLNKIALQAYDCMPIPLLKECVFSIRVTDNIMVDLGTVKAAKIKEICEIAKHF